MGSRVAFASAVLLCLSFTVAGCGADGVLTASDPPTGKEITATGGTGLPEGLAGRRAAEVASAWEGSAAERAWREGYRPLDRGEWDPPDAFRSDADKTAFLSGHLDLATVLPTSGPSGEVTWQDGLTLQRPLVTARQVFNDLLQSKSACQGADCGRRLRVTAIKSGTRTLATSRGRGTIPVWEFTVEGYAQPFTYAAVAPDQPTRGQLAEFPDPEGQGLDAVGGWTALSPDGLVLDAVVSHGSCVHARPTLVYETKDIVVLIGRVDVLPKGTICDANLLRTPVRFRLSRPLGTRTVLDAVTGNPMVLKTPGVMTS